MPASPPAPNSILMVDDNENDVILTKLGLTRAGLELPIHSVSGGLDAIAFLIGGPPYRDRSRYPLPALVLLDIKMPHMDGFEVLRWIRQQPNLVSLPVVMLTGSPSKTDALTAQKFGASSLFVKSVDFANAGELSGCIQRFIGATG